MADVLDLGGSLPRHAIEPLVAAALREDLPAGDLSSLAVVAADATARARIVAKAAGVVAGLPVVAEVFRQVDPAVRLRALVDEGARVDPATVVAEVTGPTRGILAGERVGLNFLQQLSGVATLTWRFVQQVEGTRARILDTRKTVPGLRLLQRYAVRMGGGVNHRFGLSDAILLKENHLTAAGGVTAALRKARAAAGPLVRIEVEVETLQQLEEACAAGADLIMLDNMTLDQMRDAVRLCAGQAQLEASGNMTLERVRAVAETGVDFISVGALTHSPAALDLSLRLEEG